MAGSGQSKVNQKVLFYTGISRAFRTTSIANLHEISQVWPVVLLSEKLDPETEEILKDKKLFPKLEEVVPFQQFTGEKRSLFSKNVYVYRKARDFVKKYKPTMVILPTDTYLFDFYLMRFAKKINVVNIVLNSDLRLSTAKEMSLRTDLTHIYFDLPSFLPLWLRKVLVKTRKYLGYVLYNWILPISVGELPFFGKASRIFYTMPGKRADWRIVCSEQDYDLSIKEGVLLNRLALLEHPLKRENAKKFFEKAKFINSNNRKNSNEKILTLLYPEEPYGFKRRNGSLISEEEMRKNRERIISLIAKALRGWKIFIKPHPATPKTGELKKIFEVISPFVAFTNPQDPLEQYIEMSDAILGLPPASSALFTASLQCPTKPILSLDLDQEFFGDCYKNFDGIEHIETEEKLINILGQIRDGKYRKEVKSGLGEKGGFKDAVELLNSLIKNRA